MTLLRTLDRRERITAALAAVVVLSALLGVVGSADAGDGAVAGPPAAPDTRAAGTIPQPPVDADEPAPVIGAVTTASSTSVLTEPRADAPAIGRLREGILLPVSEVRSGFFGVMTPCEGLGWVPGDAVRTHEQAPLELPDTFQDATFVLDPGHGGLQPGAVGPTGLTEEDANLDIVVRTAHLLSQPRSIGADGSVVPGDDYGVPRTLLTRNAPYTAGLRFRSAIANSLRAHAFVSVHNNAAPDGPRTSPGTETYYQFRSPHSKRLAGLMYEEIVKAITPLQLSWVGDDDAGVKYRLNDEGGDYYSVLRRTEGPAVLVEGMFISNAPEEDALRRPELRQALADAIYRALVRYITTDDPGSGFTDPYPRGSGGPSGGLHSDCVDPA